MKYAALFLTLAVAQIVSANTISVEFATCRGSQQVCGIVYADQTTGKSYNGQEMLLDNKISNEVGRQIMASRAQTGRSLAMNIEGKVVTYNGFAGPVYTLMVTSMQSNDASAPRPR